MIKFARSRLRNGLLIGRLLPVYVLLGLAKHLVALRRLVRWVWCSPVGPRNRQAERRLAAGVARLSQLTGMRDRDCLQRSLLLYRVLSRAGAEPTLVVGFQRLDSQIIGHAWVVVDGQAVVEPDADIVRFSATLHFGAQGALLPGRPEARAS